MDPWLQSNGTAVVHQWLQTHAEPLLSAYLDQWMAINSTQLLTQISTKQMAQRELAMQHQLQSLQQQITHLQAMHSVLSSNNHHMHLTSHLPRALPNNPHSPTGGSFTSTLSPPPTHTHTLGLARRTSPLALSITQQQQHQLQQHLHQQLQQRTLSPAAAADESMLSPPGSAMNPVASPTSAFPVALDVRAIMRNRLNSQMGGGIGLSIGGVSPDARTILGINSNGGPPAGLTVHRPLGLGFGATPMRSGSPDGLGFGSPPSSLPLPLPLVPLPMVHLTKGPLADLLHESQLAPGEEVVREEGSAAAVNVGTGTMYNHSTGGLGTTFPMALARETSAGSRRMSVSSITGSPALYSSSHGGGVGGGSGVGDHTARPDRSPSLVDILVVEDVGVAQKLAHATLTRAHFKVDIVGSGEAAIERFRALQPHGGVKIILMDINLPGMSGVEATDRIRRIEAECLQATAANHVSGNGNASQHNGTPTSSPSASSHPPVLIYGLTGSVDPSELQKYRSAGMNGCILKGKVLVEAVRQAVEENERYGNDHFVNLAEKESTSISIGHHSPTRGRSHKRGGLGSGGGGGSGGSGGGTPPSLPSPALSSTSASTSTSASPSPIASGSSLMAAAGGGSSARRPAHPAPRPTGFGTSTSPMPFPHMAIHATAAGTVAASAGGVVAASSNLTNRRTPIPMLTYPFLIAPPAGGSMSAPIQSSSVAGGDGATPSSGAHPPGSDFAMLSVNNDNTNCDNGGGGAASGGGEGGTHGAYSEHGLALASQSNTLCGALAHQSLSNPRYPGGGLALATQASSLSDAMQPHLLEMMGGGSESGGTMGQMGALSSQAAFPTPLPSLPGQTQLQQQQHPSASPQLALVPRRLGIGGGGGPTLAVAAAAASSSSISHKRSAASMEGSPLPGPSPASPSGGSPASGMFISSAGFDVLLVEDVRVAQRVAQRALQSAGYRVDVASSGEAAVERFKLHADSLRIVLMDINLPGMSGVEATVLIRAWERRQWLAASTSHAAGASLGPDGPLLPPAPSLISPVGLSKPPVVIFGLTGNTESSNLRLYEHSGMNGCISKGSILGHAVRAAMESVQRHPGHFVHLSGSNTQYSSYASAAAAGTIAALSPASGSSMSSSNSPLPIMRLSSSGLSECACDETGAQCRCTTACVCTCSRCHCGLDRASECSASSKRARRNEPEPSSNPPDSRDHPDETMQ